MNICIWKKRNESNDSSPFLVYIHLIFTKKKCKRRKKDEFKWSNNGSPYIYLTHFTFEDFLMVWRIHSHRKNKKLRFFCFFFLRIYLIWKGWYTLTGQWKIPFEIIVFCKFLYIFSRDLKMWRGQLSVTRHLLLIWRCSKISVKILFALYSSVFVV